MAQSMTAFAAQKGSFERFTWAWELRSVNGKGLDLRLRVPDWIEGLEAALRARLGAVLTRGNVSLSLRLSAEEGVNGFSINAAGLGQALSALAEVEAQAAQRGLTLGKTSAADLLSLRGVIETSRADEDSAPLKAALLADLETLLADFLAMRATEGAALVKVITGQLDEIARLTEAAAQEAEARRDMARDALRAAIARITQETDAVSEDRLAQELAVLAVKSDVTEEIDRLRAHITAARALLDQTAPMGRKFDFLTQEFNRETNTLCSKAQATGLTQIGLDLKHLIDQMREQVQNIE